MRGFKIGTLEIQRQPRQFHGIHTQLQQLALAFRTSPGRRFSSTALDSSRNLDGTRETRGTRSGGAWLCSASFCGAGLPDRSAAIMSNSSWMPSPVLADVAAILPLMLFATSCSWLSLTALRLPGGPGEAQLTLVWAGVVGGVPPPASNCLCQPNHKLLFHSAQSHLLRLRSHPAEDSVKDLKILRV